MPFCKAGRRFRPLHSIPWILRVDTMKRIRCTALDFLRCSRVRANRRSRARHLATGISHGRTPGRDRALSERHASCQGARLRRSGAGRSWQRSEAGATADQFDGSGDGHRRSPKRSPKCRRQRPTVRRRKHNWRPHRAPSHARRKRPRRPAPWRATMWRRRKSKWSAAQALVRSRQRAIAAAQSAVDALKAMLVYLKITAPFDGVVTERLVHPAR